MDKVRKHVLTGMDEIVDLIRRVKGDAVDFEDFEAHVALRDLEKEALSVKSSLTTNLRQALEEANRLNTPRCIGMYRS